MKMHILKNIGWLVLIPVCLFGSSFLPANARAEAEVRILVDDYSDGNSATNRLGYWTGGSPDFMQEIPLYTYQYPYSAPPYTDYRETNKALQFTYDCSTSQGFWYASNLWDAMWDGSDWINVTFLDISDFKYLSFRVKGEQGGEDFYIRLQYGVPVGFQPEPFVEIHSSDFLTVTKEWQQVNIALSEFIGLVPTKMRAIAIVFRPELNVLKGTVKIDNLAFTKGYEGYGKPESQGHVRIDRKSGMLYVDNEPFYIKGVGYQPTPIGSPVWPPAYDADEYERDFPLLINIGCNTIRTWGMKKANEWGEPGAQLMQKAEEYGLKIIAAFWIDPALDFENAAIRADIRQKFEGFVNKYKGFPALLMWGIGNECNASYIKHKHYYSLANELAEIAYRAEGSSYHPVIIMNYKLHHIGVADYNADDMFLNYLDAWGANLYAKEYRAVDWFTEFPKDIFEVYKAKSSKPLVITEYGADAFRTEGLNPIVGEEDEEAQAVWVRQNTLEIMTASDVCLGACVMAYSDEWWKDFAGTLDKHDPGPAADWHAHLPDGYANEEYWGIVSVSKDWSGYGRNPDFVTPRQLYYELQDIFTQYTTQDIFTQQAAQSQKETSSYKTTGKYDKQSKGSKK